MSTIDELFSRKSVRAYEDREIPESAKRDIISAAFQAPSAGCQQLYTVIDVTDEAIKASLAESCDHQPFIAQAKMVLIFCADCKKWYDAYLEAGCSPRLPGAGDLLLAVTDAVIAAQNAVVAAESLGIGSCYIGDIMENIETHRALLTLPDYVFPAAMLVFGYPTAQQRARKKPERAPEKFLVHENGYHELSGSQLRGMLSGRTAGQSFEVWTHAFCARKYNSDFSREMDRSVGEYLKQYNK